MYNICKKIALTLKKPIITKLFFCLLFLLACVQVRAGNIKGQVLDNHTGEPIVGCTVKIDGTNFKTITGLDGSYTFKHIPAGSYTITISSLSYEAMTQAIVID